MRALLATLPLLLAPLAPAMAAPADEHANHARPVQAEQKADSHAMPGCPMMGMAMAAPKTPGGESASPSPGAAAQPTPRGRMMMKPGEMKCMHDGAAAPAPSAQKPGEAPAPEHQH